MRNLANLSFNFVLFGQLGFSAAAYYLHIGNPSWPFWIVLYIISALVISKHIMQFKLFSPDMYFFAFIAYVIVSFAMIGESSQFEFAQRIILICILPYLCGRILGSYFHISLFTSLQIISLLYLLLIGVEIFRHPELFYTDRLILFAAQDWDRTGGDPTGFNIGTTLGSAWVAAFAYLIYKGERHNVPVASSTRFWLFMTVLSFPAILLFIGSRTSVVAITLSAVVLLSFASWLFIPKKIAWIATVITVLLVFSYFLTEQRKLLIQDIPSVLLGYFDTNNCAPSGSVLNRLLDLREAWRLFLESPLFGIGATNFGLRYCGAKSEFASPHSFFAHVLVENGLIGTGLFVMMLYKIFRAYLHRMRFRDNPHRSTVLILFSIWVFVLIQVQITGNLFYDYQVFLVTGLIISYLYNGNRMIDQSNIAYGHMTMTRILS